MNRELRSLIVATIATHPSASPAEIAQLVANNTPQADVRIYYQDLLVGPARSIANEQRRQPKPPRPKPEPAAKPTHTPTVSPKLAERRTWWQQQLASQIIIGYRETKLLAECTADDLRQAMKECDAAVGRMEARMSLYSRLIAQMVQGRAVRVKDLPEQHRPQVVR